MTPKDERGETLVEVLLAVAIMGIAVVAVMAGLTSSVLMSDIHRKQATAGTAVRAYAEAIQHSVASGHYVSCAGAAAYSSPSGFAVPSGFSKAVLSMRYWNGSSWQTTCPSDKGLQRLEIEVASDDGKAAERVLIIVRKPCGLGDSPCG